MLYGIRRFELRSLIRRLFENFECCDQFKTVDIKSTFFELTLNVMMMMIAGKRYYGEDMAQMKEARQFKEIVTETFELSGATNIGDFVPVMNLLGLSGLEEKLVMLQRKRDKFMQDLIEQRRILRRNTSSDQERSKTMIDELLSLQESEPEYYTDEIIRGMIQVIANMFVQILFVNSLTRN